MDDEPSVEQMILDIVAKNGVFHLSWFPHPFTHDRPMYEVVFGIDEYDWISDDNPERAVRRAWKIVNGIA